jgi:hypothetical protein
LHLQHTFLEERPWPAYDNISTWKRSEFESMIDTSTLRELDNSQLMETRAYVAKNVWQ